VYIEIPYSSVTDTLTELADLGKTYTFEHFVVENTIGVPLQLIFDNPDAASPEVRTPAGTVQVYDRFKCNSVIKGKYLGASAPLGGKVVFRLW
jgi:hypothetical protein